MGRRDSRRICGREHSWFEKLVAMTVDMKGLQLVEWRVAMLAWEMADWMAVMLA
jgi:hypothetical protein